MRVTRRWEGTRARKAGKLNAKIPSHLCGHGLQLFHEHSKQMFSDSINLETIVVETEIKVCCWRLSDVDWKKGVLCCWMDVRTRNTNIWTKLNMFWLETDCYLVVPFVLEWNIRVSKHKLQRHVPGGVHGANMQTPLRIEPASTVDSCQRSATKASLNHNIATDIPRTAVALASDVDVGFRHFWHQWPLMCKLLGCIVGKGCRRGHGYE